MASKLVNDLADEQGMNQLNELRSQPHLRVFRPQHIIECQDENGRAVEVDVNHLPESPFDLLHMQQRPEVVWRLAIEYYKAGKLGVFNQIVTQFSQGNPLLSIAQLSLRVSQFLSSEQSYSSHKQFEELTHYTTDLVEVWDQKNNMIARLGGAQQGDWAQSSSRFYLPMINIVLSVLQFTRVTQSSVLEHTDTTKVKDKLQPFFADQLKNPRATNFGGTGGSGTSALVGFSREPINVSNPFVIQAPSVRTELLSLIKTTLLAVTTQITELSPICYVLLGCISLYEAQYNIALRFFCLALSLNPLLPPSVRLAIGYCYYYKQQYHDAKAAFTRALNLCVKNNINTPTELRHHHSNDSTLLDSVVAIAITEVNILQLEIKAANQLTAQYDVIMDQHRVALAKATALEDKQEVERQHALLLKEIQTKQAIQISLMESHASRIMAIVGHFYDFHRQFQAQHPTMALYVVQLELARRICTLQATFQQRANQAAYDNGRFDDIRDINILQTYLKLFEWDPHGKALHEQLALFTSTQQLLHKRGELSVLPPQINVDDLVVMLLTLTRQHVDTTSAPRAELAKLYDEGSSRQNHIFFPITLSPILLIQATMYLGHCYYIQQQFLKAEETYLLAYHKTNSLSSASYVPESAVKSAAAAAGAAGGNAANDKNFHGHGHHNRNQQNLALTGAELQLSSRSQLATAMAAVGITQQEMNPAHYEFICTLRVICYYQLAKCYFVQDKLTHACNAINRALSSLPPSSTVLQPNESMYVNLEAMLFKMYKKTKGNVYGLGQDVSQQNPELLDTINASSPGGPDGKATVKKWNDLEISLNLLYVQIMTTYHWQRKKGYNTGVSTKNNLPQYMADVAKKDEMNAANKKKDSRRDEGSSSSKRDLQDDKTYVTVIQQSMPLLTVLASTALHHYEQLQEGLLSDQDEKDVSFRDEQLNYILLLIVNASVVDLATTQDFNIMLIGVIALLRLLKIDIGPIYHIFYPQLSPQGGVGGDYNVYDLTQKNQQELTQTITKLQYNIYKMIFNQHNNNTQQKAQIQEEMENDPMMRHLSALMTTHKTISVSLLTNITTLVTQLCIYFQQFNTKILTLQTTLLTNYISKYKKQIYQNIVEYERDMKLQALAEKDASAKSETKDSMDDLFGDSDDDDVLVDTTKSAPQHVPLSKFLPRHLYEKNIKDYLSTKEKEFDGICNPYVQKLLQYFPQSLHHVLLRSPISMLPTTFVAAEGGATGGSAIVSTAINANGGVGGGSAGSGAGVINHVSQKHANEQLNMQSLIATITPAFNNHNVKEKYPHIQHPSYYSLLTTTQYQQQQYQNKLKPYLWLDINLDTILLYRDNVFTVLFTILSSMILAMSMLEQDVKYKNFISAVLSTPYQPTMTLIQAPNANNFSLQDIVQQTVQQQYFDNEQCLLSTPIVNPLGGTAEGIKMYNCFGLLIPLPLPTHTITFFETLCLTMRHFFSFYPFDKYNDNNMSLSELTSTENFNQNSNIFNLLTYSLQYVKYSDNYLKLLDNHCSVPQQLTPQDYINPNNAAPDLTSSMMDLSSADESNNNDNNTMYTNTPQQYHFKNFMKLIVTTTSLTLTCSGLILQTYGTHLQTRLLRIDTFLQLHDLFMFLDTIRQKIHFDATLATQSAGKHRYEILQQRHAEGAAGSDEDYFNNIDLMVTNHKYLLPQFKGLTDQTQQQQQHNNLFNHVLQGVKTSLTTFNNDYNLLLFNSIDWTTDYTGLSVYFGHMAINFFRLIQDSIPDRPMLLPLDGVSLSYYDDLLVDSKHAEITAQRYQRSPSCNPQYALQVSGAATIQQLPAPFNLLDQSHFDDLSTVLTSHHFTFYRTLYELQQQQNLLGNASPHSNVSISLDLNILPKSLLYQSLLVDLPDTGSQARRVLYIGYTIPYCLQRYNNMINILQDPSVYNSDCLIVCGKNFHYEHHDWVEEKIKNLTNNQMDLLRTAIGLGESSVTNHDTFNVAKDLRPFIPKPISQQQKLLPKVLFAQLHITHPHLTCSEGSLYSNMQQLLTPINTTPQDYLNFVAANGTWYGAHYGSTFNALPFEQNDHIPAYQPPATSPGDTVLAMKAIFPFLYTPLFLTTYPTIHNSASTRVDSLIKTLLRQLAAPTTTLIHQSLLSNSPTLPQSYANGLQSSTSQTVTTLRSYLFTIMALLKYKKVEKERQKILRCRDVIKLKQHQVEHLTTTMQQQQRANGGANNKKYEDQIAHIQRSLTQLGGALKTSIQTFQTTSFEAMTICHYGLLPTSQTADDTIINTITQTSQHTKPPTEDNNNNNNNNHHRRDSRAPQSSNKEQITNYNKTSAYEGQNAFVKDIKRATGSQPQQQQQQQPSSSGRHHAQQQTSAKKLHTGIITSILNEEHNQFNVHLLILSCLFSVNMLKEHGMSTLVQDEAEYRKKQQNIMDQLRNVKTLLLQHVMSSVSTYQYVTSVLYNTICPISNILTPGATSQFQLINLLNASSHNNNTGPSYTLINSANNNIAQYLPTNIQTVITIFNTLAMINDQLNNNEEALYFTFTTAALTGFYKMLQFQYHPLFFNASAPFIYENDYTAINTTAEDGNNNNNNNNVLKKEYLPTTSAMYSTYLTDHKKIHKIDEYNTSTFLTNHFLTSLFTAQPTNRPLLQRITPKTHNYAYLPSLVDCDYVFVLQLSKMMKKLQLYPIGLLATYRHEVLLSLAAQHHMELNYRETFNIKVVDTIVTHVSNNNDNEMSDATAPTTTTPSVSANTYEYNNILLFPYGKFNPAGLSAYQHFNQNKNFKTTATLQNHLLQYILQLSPDYTTISYNYAAQYTAFSVSLFKLLHSLINPLHAAQNNISADDFNTQYILFNLATALSLQHPQVHNLSLPPVLTSLSNIKQFINTTIPNTTNSTTTDELLKLFNAQYRQSAGAFGGNQTGKTPTFNLNLSQPILQHFMEKEFVFKTIPTNHFDNASLPDYNSHKYGHVADVVEDMLAQAGRRNKGGKNKKTNVRTGVTQLTAIDCVNSILCLNTIGYVLNSDMRALQYPVTNGSHQDLQPHVHAAVEMWKKRAEKNPVTADETIQPQNYFTNPYCTDLLPTAYVKFYTAGLFNAGQNQHRSAAISSHVDIGIDIWPKLLYYATEAFNTQYDRLIADHIKLSRQQYKLDLQDKQEREEEERRKREEGEKRDFNQQTAAKAQEFLNERHYFPGERAPDDVDGQRRELDKLPEKSKSDKSDKKKSSKKDKKEKKDKKDKKKRRKSKRSGAGGDDDEQDDYVHHFSDDEEESQDEDNQQKQDDDDEDAGTTGATDQPDQDDGTYAASAKKLANTKFSIDDDDDDDDDVVRPTKKQRVAIADDDEEEVQIAPATTTTTTPAAATTTANDDEEQANKRPRVVVDDEDDQ